MVFFLVFSPCPLSNLVFDLGGGEERSGGEGGASCLFLYPWQQPRPSMWWGRNHGGVLLTPPPHIFAKREALVPG